MANVCASFGYCVFLDPTHRSVIVQKRFVQTIRATEFILGIGSPPFDLGDESKLSTTNVTAAIASAVGGSKTIDPVVKTALLSSVPILIELAGQLHFGLDFALSRKREPLVAK